MKTDRPVKRGDIWTVNFQNNSQKNCILGLHPALIISNNKACAFSNIIQVIPISSKEKSLPTHIELDYKSCNLDKASILLTEQILTINKENLIYMVGKIGYEDMIKAEKQISKQLCISSSNYSIETFEKLRTMLNELEELDRYLDKRDNKQLLEEREDLLKDISRFCVTYSIRIDLEKYKYRRCCDKDVKAAI